jgi:hypothetical protein
MRSHFVRWLMLWNIGLTVLLLLTIGMYASAAQASADPPVRAFAASTAHIAAARGNGTTTPIQVTRRDQWTKLLQVKADLSGTHNHECTVMVSSNAFNAPGNSEDNKYEFVLTLDDPNPTFALATTRVIDFDNGRIISDHNDMEVSSTAVYHATNEPHTFYWMARKLSENANPPSAMTISASTMSVICVKNIMQ